MTSWKEQLRGGRFRQAGFYVTSHSTDAGGRRLALHEYPGRDKPWPEDMGRKTHAFGFEAYVIGADYMALRDALIEACNEAGPGELVHPYLGSRSVICEDCQVKESTQEGGMALFTLRFIEAGDNLYPRATPQPGAAVTMAADEAIETVKTSFAERFSLDRMPQFVIEDAAQFTRRLFDTLQIPTGNIPQLLTHPRRLAEKINTGIKRDRFFAHLGVPPLRVPQMGFFEFYFSPPGGAPPKSPPNGQRKRYPSLTPSRRQQATNREALSTLTRRAGIIHETRSAVKQDYQHRGEVIAMRDDLSSRIEHETLLASRERDDPVFMNLRNLNTELVKDLNSRAPSLIRLTSLTLKESEPALVTSYRLYGDASRADEIIVRNRVIHPGAIPANQKIEILTDV